MNSRVVPRLCHVTIAGALACACLAFGASSEIRDGHDQTRAALELQRKQFEAAIGRTDAVGVAGFFTTDAKLIVADFDAVAGRAAIQKVWQFALGSGAVARLELKPEELDGLDGELPVETGTFVSFDKEGKERAQNNYMIVWKREDGDWKIYRDIASPRSAPAPTVDRVGFPQAYRDRLKQLTEPTFNPKVGMVETAYGNEQAALVATAGKSPYPYGSVLVMEFAQVVKDSAGNPLRDSDGNAQRGEVLRVDVMRREPGFGEAYGKNRAGEWEFVSYRVDGSYSTPPARSASCAACHLGKAGAANDFVFPLAMTSKTGASAPAMR
jgi:ketosteroid isomerase-like protein